MEGRDVAGCQAVVAPHHYSLGFGCYSWTMICSWQHTCDYNFMDCHVPRVHLDNHLNSGEHLVGGSLFYIGTSVGDLALGTSLLLVFK